MKFTNPKDREKAKEQTAIEAEWAALEAETAPDPVQAPTVLATPAPAAAPPVALTQEQFSALLAAIGANANAGLDVSAMTEVMRQAREPIPEVKMHSGVSAYRPDGHAVPAPQFAWPEIWWAAMDDKGEAHPLYPFDWEVTTVQEIQALNSLIPGVRGKVELADGSTQDVTVIEEKTTAGDPRRLLIGFNFALWKDRDKRNAIGKIVPLCAQLRELATVAA